MFSRSKLVEAREAVAVAREEARERVREVLFQDSQMPTRIVELLTLILVDAYILDRPELLAIYHVRPDDTEGLPLSDKVAREKFQKELVEFIRTKMYELFDSPWCVDVSMREGGRIAVHLTACE